MGGKLFIILILLGFTMFFVVMLFTTGDKNKAYIKYVLLAYPLLNFTLVNNLGPVSIFDFITVIFALTFYQSRVTHVKNGHTYLIIFILLTLIAVIGAFNAKSLKVDTAAAFIDFFTAFIFAKILIDECLNDSTFFYSVIKYLKITLIVSLLFLGGQLIFGPEFTLARIQNANVVGSFGIRYPGFFQDPQKHTQFLAITSFLLLIKDKDDTKLSVISLLLLMLSVIAMLYTGGRAGFAGWVLGVLIIIIFGSSQYRLAGITTTLILGGLVYFFPEKFPIFNRFATISDDYDFRFTVWKDAFEIFKDNPYFGIGIGNYANYVSVHNPDQVWEANAGFTFYSHPESGYLKFLTEYGLAGFILIFSLILLPMIIAFRELIKTKNKNNLLLIAALVSWMVGFYTVYSLDDTRIKILVVTVICLLITSYKRISPEDAD